MKTATLLAALAIALVPMSGSAATKSKTKTAPTTYQCAKCHMSFTAAQAKKDHFVDPMDGGKLVPVNTAPGKKNTHTPAMGGMKM